MLSLALPEGYGYSYTRRLCVWILDTKRCINLKYYCILSPSLTCTHTMWESHLNGCAHTSYIYTSFHMHTVLCILLFHVVTDRVHILPMHCYITHVHVIFACTHISLCVLCLPIFKTYSRACHTALLKILSALLVQTPAVIGLSCTPTYY